MATGVKPRDEESQLTRTDLEAIRDAMKQKKFRDLLNDYCEEVSDPANQALYQKEMTQLEKERGYDVTFLNPKGGYVIKTSVAGDRKAFINICSNDNVGKPSGSVQQVDGRKGMNWQIPYSIIPPREDYNDKKERCVIYDVVYHPDTLRMAAANKQFRDLVNKTAFDGLQKTYNIHLDNNNCRFPKSNYKGMAAPAIIRKEDPDYKPPEEEETEDLSSEVLEKLYPQHTYEQKESPIESQPEPKQQKRKAKNSKAEFSHSSDNGYTVPKFVIKQQKSVDLQDYTYHKDSKEYSAIPSHIVVEVNLPLLSSTQDCTLDVQEKSLSLISEKPAKYRLKINFPYTVNDECGHAKFDKSKRMLIVTLPVIRRNSTNNNSKLFKVDSGVESAENSGSQSEDETTKDNLVVELSSAPAEPSSFPPPVKKCFNECTETFLDTSLGYTLPAYTHNVLDDIIAFTFHVKNTEPDSVKVKKDGNLICIKFTSVGSGFVPVHYAAVLMFDVSIKFENVTGEAWDNNVILQMELTGDAPHKFQIGLSNDSMVTEYLDVSQVKKTSKLELNGKLTCPREDIPSPVVEVTNLGTETNIVVSSNSTEYDEDDIESPTSKEEEIVWTDPGTCENGAKSILRKPMSMMRSFSESSVGDVASSMDYISSDCIPEESSLKKTVRFNDVIAKQFYRYNSSIEGQKKKNQRKKGKKRNPDRRRSESEAEEEFTNSSNASKQRLKSVLKPRRDSGLADTSDAEADCKNTQSELGSSYDSRNENDNENDYNNVFDSKQGSVLNIVDNNGNAKEKSEPAPAIWKSATTDPKSVKIQGNLKQSEPIGTCDTIKHATNLCNPDTKEKSQPTPDIRKSATTEPKSMMENTGKPEPITCDNIKHVTDLYNPDNLNKGQYLEVMFKNDLIFDLDM